MHMLRQLCFIVALASLLALMVALPAGANVSAPLAGTWHRLNVARPNGAPEHERLLCVPNNGGPVGISGETWFCHFDKLPEPTLNFHWNADQGFMSDGQDITSTWSCPGWFPAGICSDVVQVVEGTMTFSRPPILHPPFSTLLDLIVQQTSSGQRLYEYWVNQHVCPWFRTFDEALAANPLPLPFNGTFPPQDCTFAG
jgi:hypothetical protein